MAKDPYEVLGVSKSANADEIKKAYRKLAMKFHPDHNKDKDAEDKLKEVNHAYDILKDEQKRAAYDRYGHSAFDGGASGGGGFGGGFGGFSSAGFGGSFSDIFEDMFGDMMGGGPRRSNTGPVRGSDIQYSYEVSLEDAYYGKEVTLTLPINDVCDSCNGSGAEKGSGAEQCPTCNGTGRVRMQQGMFTIERTCATCGGEGVIIRNPCSKCGGSGRVRKDKTLKVKIPAGIETGRRIRLVGEGEAGLRGGPAGDLYILVNIKPHKFFRRDGSNIYCRVPIRMTTAALGGEIEVPSIDGKRSKVKIPAGTQTGKQLRLKGKGMQVLRSEVRGDMLIEIVVETPVNLSKKQQELLSQLEESMEGKSAEKNSPESSGFFAKMKDFWEDLKD